MSRLALGTVQFGMAYGIANQSGQVSPADASKMLSLALHEGIDTLDTAIAYGESETILGTAGVSDFKVISKLPPVPGTCKSVENWVEEQVAASMKRLGVQSLYGLLLHHPMQLMQPEGPELYKALIKLKEQTVIGKWGVSIYASQILEALWGKYAIDIVQGPFNLLDRRLSVSGWLARLKDCEVEVHTRSTFLQGLLLMPPESRPAKFSPWNDLLNRWDQWLYSNAVSALHASLAFPLAHPEVDCVVVGADSPSHLQEICAAAKQVSGMTLPDLTSFDEKLINPSLWNTF